MISTCLWMFLGGLAGSAHCIGMCGGFAASIGALRPNWRDVLPRQLAYSLGRMTTYAFLGAMAAFAGARFAAMNIPLIGAQRIVAVASGLAMILIALHTLGLWRFTRIHAGVGELFAPLFRYFLNPPVRLTAAGASVAAASADHTPRVRSSAPTATSAADPARPELAGQPDSAAQPEHASQRASAAQREHSAQLDSTAPPPRPAAPFAAALRGAFMAGIFTGFLPCGLVYAFLAWVMNTHDPLTGLAGMASFGLGTAPAMIAIGCGAALAGVRFRARTFQIAACIMLILGLVTVYRGVISPGACHDGGAACCH